MHVVPCTQSTLGEWINPQPREHRTFRKLITQSAFPACNLLLNIDAVYINIGWRSTLRARLVARFSETHCSWRSKWKRHATCLVIYRIALNQSKTAMSLLQSRSTGILRVYMAVSLWLGLSVALSIYLAVCLSVCPSGDLATR